ncbi:PRAME family member 12-like [Acomys russatus]|uniref:PRAME family member 12-like n=1 Tax=Acomys russatus TaxID=60746 RepID=UPI0021E2FCEE|nr:PRAME family member 12-like [Acomys russatus]
MTVYMPSTLLTLAVRSVLRDEAMAISALQELPMELFPPLFKDAFIQKQANVLRAILQAWPFPCLPLGGLMRMLEIPHLERLQIILHGIDTLLAQKSHPGSYKLRVLDLRPLHMDFWDIWAGEACYPEGKSKRRPQKGGPMVAKQTLKVFVDLCLKPTPLNPCLSYVCLWVAGRKDVLSLGCRRLKITTVDIQNIVTVMEMLDLDYMEEMEVCCSWKLSTLAAFAPYMGQMQNLRKFLLSHICVPASISPEEEEQLVSQFTSQFLKLRYLQVISLDSVSFLQGQMDQMFRYLEGPLKTLFITDSQLLDSDLKSLAQCPGVQLKHLNLSGITLTNISPDHLRVLLERSADTLKTLDLENCMILDSQLETLLPALSQCFQPTTFNYLRNPVSVAVLERLLSHTAKLSCLTLEMYSTPWEVYGVDGASHYKRLEELREELSQPAMPPENTKTVWFSIIPCPPYEDQAI